MTKTVTYLRVSGLGQVRGHGITRQREAVAKYAKTHGFEIVDEFKDAGVSGTTELADRAGLAALLDRLQSNGVRTVLVERADRVARDLMVSEVILGQFRDLGVQVIEAEGGTDLTVANGDPTRTLIRQVLGAVSQFEKSVIVLKLRAARDRKRRTDGRCEGRKPYGHRPGETDIIERIRALRRKPRKGTRLSYAKIADRLNADGIVARYGGQWHAAQVRNALR